MKHYAQIEAALQIPDWSTPSDARHRLDRVIDLFVGEAAAATAEPDAALALRVTAGLGKTATALRAIARHGPVLLGRGHVLVYMPTLDLALRAHEEFRSLAPNLPSRVIRGRDARRPDDPGMQMCERAEIARKISGLVPSVTQALCRGRGPDGTFVQSPCASNCPYLRQKDVPGPHVVFLSHAYLTVDPPIDRDFPTALRVIDEKVWPTLTRTSHLSMDDLMSPPPKSYPNGLRGVLTAAKAAIVDGLQRGLPLHDHVRSAGTNTGQLVELARAEDQTRTPLEIGPWQTEATIAFRADTFDSRSFLAARRRRRLFDLLAGKESGYAVGLDLSEVQDDQETRTVIASSSIVSVARDAPLLLLDADADCDITDRIAPGAAFVSIQSPPVADIVQISDLTMSNSWLLHADKGKHRRASVLQVLAREVERAAGRGVLLVATKSVLGALHADVGTPRVGADDEVLKSKLLGADPRWYGPRTQGVNDFEQYAAIVVVGRLQPAPRDIETSARAVFSDDITPIEAHVTGPLPSTSTTMILSDGTMWNGVVRASSRSACTGHPRPDPRMRHAAGHRAAPARKPELRETGSHPEQSAAARLPYHTGHSFRRTRSGSGSRARLAGVRADGAGHAGDHGPVRSRRPPVGHRAGGGPPARLRVSGRGSWLSQGAHVGGSLDPLRAYRQDQWMADHAARTTACERRQVHARICSGRPRQRAGSRQRTLARPHAKKQLSSEEDPLVTDAVDRLG